MVARYSDATKLKQAKFLAREGGCFVVERTEQAINRMNGGQLVSVVVWSVYRVGEPRNIFVGKRSSIAGLLSLVKKATASK